MNDWSKDNFSLPPQTLTQQPDYSPNSASIPDTKVAPKHKHTQPIQMKKTHKQSANISQQSNYEPHQLSASLEKQFLSSLDSMLSLKLNKITQTLSSIDTRVHSIGPTLTINPKDTQILLKGFQKSITSAIDRQLPQIRNSINMSVNYYNTQLTSRQKRFNKERKQMVSVSLENNANILQIKEKKVEMDCQRLEERIKMLMRSEGKCEELMGVIDGALSNVEGMMERGKVREGQIVEIDGEEYQLVEVGEEELMQMVLENYEIEWGNPHQMGMMRIRQ